MATKATSLTGTADGAPARSQAGLSIVVPVFNEAAGLSRFHDRLVELARTLRRTRGLKCEVVYVDDGSRDETFAVASALPAEALDIQIIALSRNFGKEAALMAGLDHARLGGVLFMDGDGQHPPSLVERLVSHWLDDGYDVVYTAKAHRENEPALRRFSVKTFYSLINWGARQKIPEDAGDFRLLSPRAADALRRLPERSRFFKGLASWIGFRQIRVDYEPAERLHGSTNWNLRSLIGLSIEGLTSFSVAPLRLASLFGLLLAVSAFVFGTKIFIEAVFFGIEEKGYASVVIGIMVIGGVQLVMIGVLGEYIGKILSEIKARPVYFVAEHSIKSAKESADFRNGAHGGGMSVTRARIWLCADDYGISPSVNSAIRDLIARGRINATSVMVAAPSFLQSDAAALNALNAGTRRAAIGLHVTLTAPFKPLTAGFERTYADAFLSLPPTLVLALIHRFRQDQIAAEIAAQFEAFNAKFGRAPDFIDGHQHVQLFPQIRDTFLAVSKGKAPLAWVRQCGRIVPFSKRLADTKGLLLDVLSSGFRTRAAQLAVRTNPAFAGTYDFSTNADFAKLFPSFLNGLPENSVVMCHPGTVDDELKRLDQLTTLREKEYAYFSDERFPAVLESHGIALA